MDDHSPFTDGRWHRLAVPDLEFGRPNKRHFPRRKYGKIAPLVWLLDLEGGLSVHQARVINLSRGGVQLVTTGSRAIGEQGLILLRADARTEILIGLIVRSVSHAHGIFHTLGCQFSDPPVRLLRMVCVEGGRMRIREAA